MPGIFEASAPENGQLESSVETLSLNEQQSTTEDEQPTRETDQTDKINNFLLKSFLQHINSNATNVPEEQDERNSEGSNADWN